MAGYLVEQTSAERLAKMLSDYESGGVSDGRGRDGFFKRGSGSFPVNVVQVTGAQDAGGWWPGSVLLWDNVTLTYTTLMSIRIREINAGALAIGQKYLGRVAGIDNYSGTDYPVYLVAASGSVGGVLSLDFITSISCVDGVITPVYSTVCIPGAYICTTTTTTAAPTSSTSTSSTSSTSTSSTSSTSTSSTSTSSTSSTSSSSTSSSTTSTTTTCDTTIYGYCVWQWNGFNWAITSNNCIGMAYNSYPTFSGTMVGETTVTCCIPM